MPKGTVLTKDVKRIISEIYLKHPKWKTHETHKEVLRQVQQRIQYAEPGWPGYSVVQKELVKIRKRDEERSPESKRLDEAWVFSDLSKYPISSESMSLLISIYDKCWYENMLLGADTDEWLLSVREALWVGRLHKIIEFYKPGHMLPDVRNEIQDRVHHATDEEREMLIELSANNKDTNWDLALLWGLQGREIPIEDVVLEWASTYASYEELSEIEGVPFDSSELDHYLMIDVYEFFGDRIDGIDIYEKIGNKYSVDVMKLENNYNLPIGDILKIAISQSNKLDINDTYLLTKYYKKYYGKDIENKE